MQRRWRRGRLAIGAGSPFSSWTRSPRAPRIAAPAMPVSAHLRLTLDFAFADSMPAFSKEPRHGGSVSPLCRSGCSRRQCHRLRSNHRRRAVEAHLTELVRNRHTGQSRPENDDTHARDAAREDGVCEGAARRPRPVITSCARETLPAAAFRSRNRRRVRAILPPGRTSRRNRCSSLTSGLRFCEPSRRGEGRRRGDVPFP